MSLYERYALPRLINLSMQNKVATEERAKLVPQASGIVLEIGAGSCLNIPFYGPGVKKLYALDPSRELWKLSQTRVRKASFPIEFLEASAEQIPLPEQAVDTVVSTWSLCTIPDPKKALAEMRRVLKASGCLIFIEHGHAPDKRVLLWQDRLNPFWKRIAGGCNLNRKMDDLITSAGFKISRIERCYARGPKPMVYLYEGIAEPQISQA